MVAVTLRTAAQCTLKLQVNYFLVYTVYAYAICIHCAKCDTVCLSQYFISFAGV